MTTTATQATAGLSPTVTTTTSTLRRAGIASRRARKPIPLQGQRIHFVGIGGIGMAALAELLHARGCTVTGPDLVEGATALRLAGTQAAALTADAELLLIKGKGASARLEAGNLGHDYDAGKAIYVSIYMRTAARGRMTMTYGWTHNNKSYTGDESKELAPGQWVVYTFSVRTPARINNIKLNLPIGNGEAAIKFVKVHPERTPPKKAAAEWLFEK